MARSIILDISVVGGSVVVKSIILDISVVEWSVVVQSFLVDNSVVCRSVVVKSRELDEPVKSCRAVVDISVAIRSVEVEPTLRLVVSDKGTSEEVESKRLVNSGSCRICGNRFDKRNRYSLLQVCYDWTDWSRHIFWL